ncbi:unnamed protein product [Cladocopium goreaui]|uniref:Trophinin n=1 Tax=Cladocopium goreaui TaxID=2562237 RepID=A0A9P1CHG9_9DINO|nr:unnamed protein product [Cladocopium goreaui]
MDLGDPLMSVKKMREVFRKYDTDKDGTISRQNLEEILRKLVPGISQLDLDLVFRKIDKNFNNMVEYDEFVNLLFFDPTAPEPRTPAHHVTREASYILYLFWQLAGGAKQFSQVPLISRSELLKSLQPRGPVILALRQRIHKLEGEIAEMTSKAEDKMLTRLTSNEVYRKLQAMKEEEISQEIFIPVVFPGIKRFDLKFVLGCFRRFWAQEGLSNILHLVSEEKKDPKGRLKVEIPVVDLKNVFDVLDEDDDGTISIKEMVQQGALEVKDALYLSELLDKGQDGEVSLAELMNLVVGTSGEVSESLKGLFAARMAA